MEQLLELAHQPEAWVSLITLILLEAVLGIDNLVFITILAGRLPKERQLFARRVGLGLAMVTRIGLLLALSWIMGLKSVLFSAFGHDISGKDLILIGGGLFLMVKACFEIYDKVEAEHTVAEQAGAAVDAKTMGWILFQIALLDIVFSLDSVITAVGMVPHVSIMVIAVLVSVLIMLIFAGPIGDFIERHPSMKVLALSFLVMIGLLLVAEGTGQHFPKGYVYFGMAFSLSVEFLNMRYRKRRASLDQKRSVLSDRPRIPEGNG